MVARKEFRSSGVGQMLENRALSNRLDEDSLLVPAARSIAAPEPTPPSFVAIVWRRRWVFLACVVLAMAGAIAYQVKTPAVYSASSQIYVQQSTPKVLSDALVMGATSSNYLYTQCDLIKSPAILASALESTEVRQTRTLKDVDNPVGYLRRSTDATVGKQSDLITVTVEAPVPQDAAILTNAVVDSYITYQNKRQQTTAAQFLAMLQKEKDKAEKELAETNKAMLAFKQANGTLSFESDKGNIITQRLQELSEALTRAQLDTIDAKVMLDATTAMGNDPVKLKQLLMAERGGMAETRLPGDNNDLWGEYRRLKRAAQEAKDTYGPSHRLVKAYEQQLNDIKHEIDSLDAATLSNYLAVVQQQYIKAKTKQDELQKEMELQRQAALDLNAKAAQYAQFELDAKRAQSTLDMLYNRIKELNFTEDAQVRIDILEVARPSNMPVRPKQSRSLGIGLVLGLLSGLMAAMLQDWMDQRLRSVDEIRSTLEIPVLGVIPHILGKQKPGERGQEVYLQPRSNVAEAYRTVRTAIFFGVPDGKSKTLLVTSPSPGDGKTTLASNLSIAIAQSGRRVLLIDADMRKPMQHRIFKLSDETGLSSIVMGQANAADAIQKTAMQGLDILPCGPIPSNPSEILNSQAFMDLINSLSQQYDQLVIDSPPVEPVTDARILAASCDVTVLVLRADKSTRKPSAHARDALMNVGANLLGAVVNDVPRGQGGYAYYNGQGYYRYAYGKSGEANGARKEIKAITVANGEE